MDWIAIVRPDAEAGTGAPRTDAVGAARWVIAATLAAS